MVVGARLKDSTVKWSHTRPIDKYRAVDLNWKLLVEILAPDPPSDGVVAASRMGTVASPASSVSATTSESTLVGVKQYIRGLLWCLNCYRRYENWKKQQSTKRKKKTDSL